jgi:hypothetical protein
MVDVVVVRRDVVVDDFVLVLAPRSSPHLLRFTLGHAKLYARSAAINVFSLFQTSSLNHALRAGDPGAPRSNL